MRVDILVPDTPLPNGPANGTPPDGGGFGALVDAAGAVLEGADRAEAAFAAHRGGLQEMVVDRARADIALQVAATAAQRGSQALQSLLGMQI